jgi:hypothetical protein
MKDQRRRTFGAAFVLVQGLATALFPQLSTRFVQRAIGKNFDNAAELEAKPAYLRQLRAVGVGMVAAAGVSLLLQSSQEEPSEENGADQPADDGKEAESGTDTES